MKRESVALVDEARCIGCTRCIDACPVDAIVGAQGVMHTVVEPWCIGCALCLPPCPVDCIDMVVARGEWTDGHKRAAGKRARALKARGAKERAVVPAADRRAVLERILATRKR